MYPNPTPKTPKSACLTFVQACILQAKVGQLAEAPLPVQESPESLESYERDLHSQQGCIT